MSVVIQDVDPDEQFVSRTLILMNTVCIRDVILMNSLYPGRDPDEQCCNVQE